MRNITELSNFQEFFQQEQFAYRTKLLIGLAIFLIAGISFSLSFTISNATHAATDSVTDIHSISKVLGTETINWRGAQQGIYYGTTTDYGYTGIASGTSLQNDKAEPLLQVQLNGLTPGTLYHYKIGLNGIDHTFKTRPLNK